MAILKPFKAFRPEREKASLIASKPYDVINTAEAKIEVKGNPLSFLHIVKPEIDFPDDQITQLLKKMLSCRSPKD